MNVVVIIWAFLLTLAGLAATWWLIDYEKPKGRHARGRVPGTELVLYRDRPQNTAMLGLRWAARTRERLADWVNGSDEEVFGDDYDDVLSPVDYTLPDDWAAGWQPAAGEPDPFSRDPDNEITAILGLPNTPEEWAARIWLGVRTRKALEG